jgi:hypothetical protein
LAFRWHRSRGEGLGALGCGDIEPGGVQKLDSIAALDDLQRSEKPCRSKRRPRPLQLRNFQCRCGSHELQPGNDSQQARALRVVFEMFGACFEIPQDGFEFPARGALCDDVIDQLFSLVRIAGVEGRTE